MTRSPLRRSLVFAVSASLAAVAALTGPASANSIAQQLNNDNVIRLYTLASGGNVLSAKDDGTDSRIRLLAGAGKDIAELRFSYRPSSATTPDFTTIATLSQRNARGAFAFDWTPSFPAAVTITLRVEGIKQPGGTFANPQTTLDVPNVLVDFASNGTNRTVSLNRSNRLGYFVQPTGYGDVGSTGSTFMVISGTTSAYRPVPAPGTPDPVSVQLYGALGDELGAPVNAAVTGVSTTTNGAFAAKVALPAAYTFDTENQLVVGATLDTDDVDSYSLYKQEIFGSTVTVDKTTGRVATNGTTPVVVTVKDAEGLPIAGAQVRRVVSNDPPPFDASGPTAYTNQLGQATFAQGVGSFFYFANADNDDVFATPRDVRSQDVVVSAQTITALKANSADGPAFDKDEFSLAQQDITVSVRDQDDQVVTNSPTATRVAYYWSTDAFSGFFSDTRVPRSGFDYAPVAQNTGAADIDLPNSPDGVFTLRGRLEQSSNGAVIVAERVLATYKVGEASISFTKASPEVFDGGTTAPITGRLQLADGTGLGGRTLNATFSRGSEDTGAPGNAGILNPSTGARGLTGTVVTDAGGNFVVQVSDPAVTPQPGETGGALGVAGAAPNQDASSTGHVVNFRKPVAVGNVVIAPETLTNAAGKTPGRPVASSVKVTEPNGTVIPNKAVVLSTDKGFFTDLTSATGTAAGNDTGNLTNLGSSITVTTNAQGVAAFNLAIGRDTGFDDDGKVDATITAAAGGQSDTEIVDWTTANPLNGGRVRLELAPANLQESTVLPKAPISDDVAFDVVVEDQFANPVGGETVTITDNTPDAATSVTTVTSDFVKDADVTATATAATSQTVTASWTTETSKFNSAVPAAAVAGTETLTSAYTVTWYVVDPAASTVTFTSNKATADPGTSVTTTYTAKDQFGEAVSDLYVQFFRSGPGSEGGSAPAAQELLGQDGVATFAFTGNSAGPATVSVAGRVGTATGPVVSQAAKTLTVTFAGGKAEITPLIGAQGRGAKADKVAVYEPAASGATVKLYRLKGNDVILVAIKTLDAQGLAVFEVADTNKRRRTNYAAIVEATSTTQQGVTEIVKPR